MGDEAPESPILPNPKATRVLHLMEQGRTYGEIAAELKCDLKTIWRIRDRFSLDQLYRERAQERMVANARYMEHATRRALRVHEELMESDDERIRLAAAKEVVGWTIKAAELAAARDTGGGAAEKLTTDELVSRARRSLVTGSDSGGSEG